jgi:ElaB/YqjD/DUF883 family membrane-anchored ribosome-binding protein
MRNKLRVLFIGLMAVAAGTALQAAENPAEAPNPSDPSVNQVYEAARAGHLDQAKQMMAIVLAHHPQSSRAHYVAAEIDADMKNYGDAREELGKAEQLEPGLPNVNPRSVAELRKEIGAPAAQARGPAASVAAAREPAKSFPWGFVGIVAAVVFVLWLLLRRRQAAVPGYSAYPPGTMPNATMGPGPMMPPPGGFPSVMGAGSGLVGGLASGLAVGAGIAAGEELVEHAFGHGREGANVVPERYAGNDNPANIDPNADLGGPDFGVSDNGGGWDDGGSSGGDSGGGDWT